MNTVLAPSATMLTVENHGEDNYPFREIVSKLASLKTKSNSLTREKQTLNSSKLVSSVVAHYRATFAGIYGKKENISAKSYMKIVDEVDNFIMSQIERVNIANISSLKRAFKYNANRNEDESAVVEQITLIGENQISLKEQAFAILCYIGNAKKQLAQLQAKLTPNYSLETKIKDKIENLENEKVLIEQKIAALIEAAAK